MAHLTYDHQAHAIPMGDHSPHNERMINYDQQHLGQLQQHQQHDNPDSMPMMMMKMYFHFGLGDMVLFKSLVIDSTMRMCLTSIALFLLAILLEAIDYSRGYLSCRCAATNETSRERQSSAGSQTHLIRDEPDGSEQQTRQSQSQPRQWNCCNGSGNASTGGPQLWNNTNGRDESAPSDKCKHKLQYFPIKTNDSTLVRAAQSCLNFVRTGLALCLMLVAMTYNLCLIFPILLGSGVGFYIFYRPALDSKSVTCH